MVHAVYFMSYLPQQNAYEKAEDRVSIFVSIDALS